MEGSASQTLHLETKSGTQHREKRKCWREWWKKWTNNTERKRVVGGLLSRHAMVSTATCSSQNKTPAFLPHLLDVHLLFLVEENKTQGKENVGWSTTRSMLLFLCCFAHQLAQNHLIKWYFLSDAQLWCTHNEQVYLTLSTSSSV